MVNELIIILFIVFTVILIIIGFRIIKESIRINTEMKEISKAKKKAESDKNI